MLWASAGISKRTPDFAFRSAPSAGALYPVETYIVANNVEGLEAGLYHYNVKGHILERLREGQLRDTRDGSSPPAISGQIDGESADSGVWTGGDLNLFGFGPYFTNVSNHGVHSTQKTNYLSIGI
jgi:hypothetical protein